MKQNNLNLLMKTASDEDFIKRTNLALIRVENDDGDWLSVDDFLKVLESW